MINIEIDGKQIQTESGATIIEARNRPDYHSAFLLSQETLHRANCRMCWYRWRRRPSHCCLRHAGCEGMKVYTHSEQAVKAQQGRDGVPAGEPPAGLPICDQAANACCRHVGRLRWRTFALLRRKAHGVGQGSRTAGVAEE